MATGKRIRKRVYCSECAHLFLMEGIAPTCIASCRFIQGPLRRIIDIAGIVSAEKRNRYNNCKFFARFDFAAVTKKRWLKRKLQLEGLDLKKMTISQYTLKEERARKESFVHDKRKKETEDASGHSELGYAGKRLEELKEELQEKEDSGRSDEKSSARSKKRSKKQQNTFFEGLTDEDKRNLVTK